MINTVVSIFSRLFESFDCRIFDSMSCLWIEISLKINMLDRHKSDLKGLLNSKKKKPVGSSHCDDGLFGGIDYCFHLRLIRKYATVEEIYD